MHSPTDYEKITLNAYRSRQRASEYKENQTNALSWARFSTWREQRILFRELSRYRWSDGDRLLDIPCGTGILGRLLQRLPFNIVASDISPEMMDLAREEYPHDRFIGSAQADITKTGFHNGMFACVVTLGFLHRVPLEIKWATLSEIAALSNRVVIITCSVDTAFQRFKHKVLSRVKPNHAPAPCPAPLKQIISYCNDNGLKLVRTVMVTPFLSAHALMIFEKRLK